MSVGPFSEQNRGWAGHWFIFLPQWWIDMPHLTKEILPMGIIPTIRMEF